MDQSDFKKAWNRMGEQFDCMQAELAELRRWKNTVDKYPDLPAVLRPKDIAAAAKISLTKAYEIMSDGSMQVFYCGKSPRCPRDEFIRWMQAGGSGKTSKGEVE